MQKGYILVLADFHFLQNWAYFWQTDLFWHEKDYSLIYCVCWFGVHFSKAFNCLYRGETCYISPRSNTYTAHSLWYNWVSVACVSNKIVLLIFFWQASTFRDGGIMPREDTHYLLYICDRLHNELIKSGNANSNLLQSVYTRSKDICLKVCNITWLLV